MGIKDKAAKTRMAQSRESSCPYLLVQLEAEKAECSGEVSKKWKISQRMLLFTSLKSLQLIFERHSDTLQECFQGIFPLFIR